MQVLAVVSTQAKLCIPTTRGSVFHVHAYDIARLVGDLILAVLLGLVGIHAMYNSRPKASDEYEQLFRWLASRPPVTTSQNFAGNNDPRSSWGLLDQASRLDYFSGG